ncbi:uncharacterized protein LOC115667637 [Syzygium oleosum]|uniref:uncharacterized protein LOC115667637 n=1 Tax=Syzygium oleosum TaxID=219896 RepID=UPI0024BA62C6|nr:uncharacterized protein LOC115667637 [Syzygium oleosum]
MPNAENVAANGNGGRTMHGLVEQFLKLQPPKFIGTGDPEEAESWIDELQKAFELLRCSEEEKVTLAAYQLQGNASYWWKATKEIVFPENAAVNWNAFNNMTVDQYKARFAQLSRYALKLIEDPVERAKRFRDGLNPDIRRQLVPLNLKDYNELYERAQLVEKESLERATTATNQGKPYHPTSQSNQHHDKRPMSGENRFSTPNKKIKNQKPISTAGDACRTCGRFHGNAPCPKQTGACFGYGQQGHCIKDCPQRQQVKQSQQPQAMQQKEVPSHDNRPPAQGRIYAITQEEVENSENVITET